MRETNPMLFGLSGTMSFLIRMKGVGVLFNGPGITALSKLTEFAPAVPVTWSREWFVLCAHTALDLMT